MIKEIEKNISSKLLEENYKNINSYFTCSPTLIIRVFRGFRINKKFEWPLADKRLIKEDKVDYIIQINGKKRAILNENRDIDKIIF